MAKPRERSSMDAPSRSSLEKTNIEHVERYDENSLAAEILSRYPLLVGKSEVEKAALNKKVLRKLDWKFLVCSIYLPGDLCPETDKVTSHALRLCFS
jgi:hypothetical protein